MEAAFFIGLVIFAVLKVAKDYIPAITGGLTILIALGVGVLVAIFGPAIGIIDITVAQGVVAGLSAVGINAAAEKAGGSTD